jgi:hypothetical protein
MAWCAPADVAVALGLLPADVDADAWLASSTDAANAWAFTKRAGAGYADDPDTSPGADVTQGTVIYAAALYRATRGGGDTAPSFDQADMVGLLPTGGMAHVLRLLHVGKAQVF